MSDPSPAVPADTFGCVSKQLSGCKYLGFMCFTSVLTEVCSWTHSVSELAIPVSSLVFSALGLSGQVRQLFTA